MYSITPFNYRDCIRVVTHVSLLQGSLYSLMLYDAVSLYLQLVDETIKEGGDYRDGALLAKKAGGRSLQGIYGPIYFPILLASNTFHVCMHP